MAARSLGLAAAFGLAANAFLLPTVTDLKEDMELAPWVIEDTQTQPVLAFCQGCETHKTGPMNLFLNITTGSQPGTLELGGKPFYPPSEFLLNDPSNKPEAQLVPVGRSLFDVTSASETYTVVPISDWSYSLQQSETWLPDGQELLAINFHITNVNGDKVSVPDVRVSVLREPKSDNLILLGVNVKEGEEAPQGYEIAKEHKLDCETALCQWRQFVEDKVHGIAAAAHHRFGSGRPSGSGRPCPGKVTGMTKFGKPYGPPFTNMHHGPDSHHHRPLGEAGRPHPPHGHPEFHHGHHHAHHKFHEILHRVGRVITAVVVPILIGFAAGVFAYALGMVVGCAIGLIWITVFRGGKKGYASVAHAEDEAAAKEAEAEAEPRTSFESAPPVYEDAPAYEEKQVV